MIHPSLYKERTKKEILKLLQKEYDDNSQDIDPNQPSWSAETLRVVADLIQKITKLHTS